MEYRTLGRTGFSVSAISLGCEGFTGKSAGQVRADLDFAQANGVNFIDLFASNPEVRSNLGCALRGRREKFIIQGHLCSVWEEGQYLRSRDLAKSEAAFADLLERLDTDYIDVGMIHYVDSAEDFDEVFGGPIIEFAKRLRAEGRIRSIGMSSHNPVVARKAVESGLVDVLLFSINPCYDMQPPGEVVDALWAPENYAKPLQNLDPQREALYELCAREGVGIDVMKAYGGGDLLSPDYAPFGRPLTPVQCIEYALTRPAVAAVMLGYKNDAELQAGLDWCTATPEQRDYATALAGLDKFTWQGHCMYCGHCAPCAAAIDIAAVNKYLNLAIAQSGVPETVRDHYALLEHHAGECLSCGACEERCPFAVPIMERMARAAEVFGK